MPSLSRSRPKKLAILKRKKAKKKKKPSQKPNKQRQQQPTKLLDSFGVGYEDRHILCPRRIPQYFWEYHTNITLHLLEKADTLKERYGCGAYVISTAIHNLSAEQRKLTISISTQQRTYLRWMNISELHQSGYLSSRFHPGAHPQKVAIFVFRLSDDLQQKETIPFIFPANKHQFQIQCIKEFRVRRFLHQYPWLITGFGSQFAKFTRLTLYNELMSFLLSEFSCYSPKTVIRRIINTYLPVTICTEWLRKCPRELMANASVVDIEKQWSYIYSLRFEAMAGSKCATFVKRSKHLHRMPICFRLNGIVQLHYAAKLCELIYEVMQRSAVLKQIVDALFESDYYQQHYLNIIALPPWKRDVRSNVLQHKVQRIVGRKCFCCKRKERRTEEEIELFRKCSGCHVAVYCSRKCQKIDWKRLHHFDCKYMAQNDHVYGANSHSDLFCSVLDI